MAPNVLSRRRSSEQGNQSAIPRSPTLSRLKSALRGVDILFSVIAHVETAPNASNNSISPSSSPQRPNIPRIPDSQTETSPSDTSGVRRLFSRESRHRATTSVSRLAVGTPSKHASQLRLYQLIDYGATGRVNVQRSWSLADLRRIDGLGESVEHGVAFALRFASTGKIFAWRAVSPHARASFLWSLLQACVSRLKRAPPVDGLRLLDLQTMAESSVATASSLDNPDDGQSSSNLAGSEPSNVHLNSSIDELAEIPSDNHIKSQHNASGSDYNRYSSTSHTRSSRLNGTLDGSAHDQAHELGVFERSPNDGFGRLSSSHAARESLDGKRSHNDGLLVRDSRSTVKKVTRTLSEPGGAMLGLSDDISDESDVEVIARRADTIAQGEQTVERHLKNMNLDERAFLAAAKRLGGRRSYEMGRGDVIDRFSSMGNDPRALGFPNRVPGNVTTSRLVAEVRILQENKMFKLSADEKKDLQYALKLFSEQDEQVSLSEFGNWSGGQIQALEVENTADVVKVEQIASLKDQQTNGGKSCSHVDIHEHPHELLIEAMTYAGTWLQNCETGLAPYASLAEDINNDIVMLQLQRKNASDLAEKLDQVLEAISFTEEEQQLINGIDHIDFGIGKSQIDSPDMQKTIALLTSKSEALSKLSRLSDMTAIAQVRQKATSKRERASSVLLPTLKAFLDNAYRCEQTDSSIIMSGLQSLKLDRDLTKFRNGSNCLLACGVKSFDELIQHYHKVSRHWVQSLITFSMSQGSPNPTYKIGRSEAPIKTLVEVILYASILETIRVHRLFELSAIKKSQDNEFQDMVKNTIGGNELFDEFIAKPCEEEGPLEPVALLHSSCVLECMVQVMKGCTSADIDSVISRVESTIPTDSESELALYELDSMNGYLDDNIFVETSRKSLSLSLRGRNGNPNSISNDKVIMQEAMSSFEEICRELSRRCEIRAGKQVETIVSSITSLKEVTTITMRDDMFSAVKNGIDVCVGLARLSFDGPEKVECFEIAISKSKPLCEEIVATAMRSTEDVASKAPDTIGDALKLQCYGYIAAKLREASNQQYLAQMSHVSTRVRKHVLMRWAEREVFDKELASLKIRGHGLGNETAAEYAERIAQIDSGQLVERITVTLTSALGKATSTVALIPILVELTSFCKGKMDELLRLMRRDREIASFRPQLASLARQVMTSLRASFETLKQSTDFSTLQTYAN